MRHLTLLDLSDNKLTAVPPEIGQLVRLTSLDLGGNELAFIPPEIEQLSNLTFLNLTRNQLTALPPEIGQLTNLTELHLSGNRLTIIPVEIGKLTKLTKFNGANNELIALPSEIGKLSNLASLNLISNQLTTIPPEIGQLTNLEELTLWKNKLTTVPSEIDRLSNLKLLDLSYNQLIVVPVGITPLNNLFELNLRGNQLQHISETVGRLSRLRVLDLRDNPELSISQEVLAQIYNPSLILQAYFGERRPLHEAKMLLVGQGGVGKTALARRLLYNLPPDDNQGKTPGVDIHKWKAIPTTNPHSPPPDPITLNLWDFGGQGVYQATHQFFFTSRSLYLVVVNARTGERESRLHHWLKLVASLSDNAPVIIVVNKQDEHALQLDERALKYKYPNLLSIIPTSCTTGAGIPSLQEAIAAALTHLPGINDRFPVKWLALKKQLEVMDTNYITFERYAEYCRAAGIESRDDQRSWGNVLHQLGVVLNYQDDKFRQLEGTHVLKPEWVTDGVYRILSDPDQRIADNNGILTAATLDHILDPDEYPRYQQSFIVGMMQKFELSYPLPNRQDQHLIPDLLPTEQPETGFLEKPQFLDAHLEFQIHYTEFLPASILSRFMVGMMAALDQTASWRNGAVLRFDGNTALVRADLDARKLFITVGGTASTRRSLLNSIRMQLHAIHATFPNLPLTEQIPLPAAPNKTIAYHALCNLEAKGIEQYYDPINDIDLDVQALLAGIETPALRRERQLQEQLIKRHDLEGLRQLCFDLGVDYDDLPSQTKSAKTRELVQFMGRRGRLDALEKAMDGENN